MKINRDAVARAALELLDRVGLDGLTMRLVAKELDVQAPALYWHVKNKQELLDAMATLLFSEAADGLEAPRQGQSWADWLSELARRMRTTLLRHRDGALVFAGSALQDPVLLQRTVELTLRALVDAGFELHAAARGFPVLLHYTVGFCIEEQSRANYGADGPYAPEAVTAHHDAERYPLTAQVITEMVGAVTDESFDAGLRIVLAGLDAERVRR